MGAEPRAHSAAFFCELFFGHKEKWGLAIDHFPKPHHPLPPKKSKSLFLNPPNLHMPRAPSVTASRDWFPPQRKNGLCTPRTPPDPHPTGPSNNKQCPFPQSEAPFCKWELSGGKRHCCVMGGDWEVGAWKSRRSERYSRNRFASVKGSET